MSWIVLTDSLPTRASSPRVTLWRRLRRLGAVSPTGSLYILPALDECVEAFQWLAQEIRQAEGEALTMTVEAFDGLEEEALIDLFNEARSKEYGELLEQIEALKQELDRCPPGEAPGNLDRLQRQAGEIRQIDYFHAPDGAAVTAALDRLERRLQPPAVDLPDIPSAAIDQLRGRPWVTRPRPHVDRLACAWLIRRYIDPHAVIRYRELPASDEIPFDMAGVPFGHQGSLCSFEVLLRALDLKEPPLLLIAELVHELDLRDGQVRRPEAAGVDALLRGWLRDGVPDDELENRGIALFEGLFAHFSHQPGVDVTGAAASGRADV